MPPSTTICPRRVGQHDMTVARPFPLDIRLMQWATGLLCLVLSAMALIAVGWWVARQPIWTLQGITVEGDTTHQNPLALRTHLLHRLEGSFLTVNVRAVQALMLEVPWVRRAEVQRQFPNRLRIVIDEHEPVAWWGQAGSGQLVNRDGEVFEATPDESLTTTWTELAGPPDRATQVFGLYAQLKPAMDALGYELQRIELSSRGSWSARLRHGTRLELGRGSPEAVMARVADWSAALPALAQRYGQRDIETVDLRYPNGFALRMRGVSTLIEPPPAPPVVRPTTPDVAASAASTPTR